MLLNNILKNINIDNYDFKNYLNKLNVKELIISNGIISPKNSIFINELEVNKLIKSLVSSLNDFKKIERKYLSSGGNKIEYFQFKDQMIELINSNITLTKRSEAWLRMLFVVSIGVDIKSVRIIYRKDNIYKYEILNSPGHLNANKLINEYINIKRNCITNCLPLPPESSYKYVKALLTNKDPEKAFIESWVTNNFSKGERDKPEMQICFGYDREPAFFLENKNFKTLSSKLYKPLIDSFGK